MSNLDNLIVKILNDCEEESKRIIKAAETEAAEAIKINTEAAEKEKEQLLVNAGIEAERIAEQMLLSKKLEIRDEILSAKREILDKVFMNALQRLNNLSKDDYLKYLHNGLVALSQESGELILPYKYNINENEIHSLFTDNQMNEIKLADKGRQINGGFILVKDGIEYNRTFEVLLQYYRYEMENEIIKILF